jgi:hypothetical protein
MSKAADGGDKKQAAEAGLAERSLKPTRSAHKSASKIQRRTETSHYIFLLNDVYSHVHNH